MNYLDHTWNHREIMGPLPALEALSLISSQIMQKFKNVSAITFFFFYKFYLLYIWKKKLKKKGKKKAIGPIITKKKKKSFYT